MDNWLKHPGLKNIDPLKLELIKTAVSSTSGKSGNALAPILLSLITSANKKGIQFSSDEISLILEIMKEGKNPAERAQIEKTVQMMQSILKRKKV